MASKELKDKIVAAATELMVATGIADSKAHYVDFGMDGCRIESPAGPPPFGFERYQPAAFLTALQFAKSVVEAGK